MLVCAAGRRQNSLSLHILGTGSALPSQVVSNDDLTAFLDTSDEWIRTRTGICERRILKEETLYDLAVAAGRRALEDADVSPETIDLVIVSTLQGDLVSPSMSILIQKDLGLTKCTRALDINMGCTGFLYALDAAESFFSSGKAKRALILCAEAMSKFADWRQRSTCVLFGDGAGAAVAEAGGTFDVFFRMKPEWEHLYIPRNRGNCPFEHKELAEEFLAMNGQEIYKFAVASIVRDIEDMLARQCRTAEEVSYYLLHQANLRILESARRKLGQPESRFPHNVDRVGNMSSASIPVLLDEVNRKGMLRRGDRLILGAFGAGLTSCAAWLVW